MHSIFDIGAAPANEDCAQLGQRDDFERLNRLEVDAYRAAIQARFGVPPEGWRWCAFATRTTSGSI